MYISLSYSIHGRNKVKGSGKILWYSRGQSPNLLSNSIQISKCTKIWGRVVIDRFNNFFWLSLCKKKKQYYLCHAHPNHKYSSVWLRTGGCHVDSVKRTIVTEPSLSSNPVYQMQTFYIHIYFILFKVAHYTGKYFLKSVTWLW